MEGRLFGYSVAELCFDGFGRLYALVVQSFDNNKCKIEYAFGCMCSCLYWMFVCVSVCGCMSWCDQLSHYGRMLMII